jgi:hypothetical protein
MTYVTEHIIMGLGVIFFKKLLNCKQIEATNYITCVSLSK